MFCTTCLALNLLCCSYMKEVLHWTCFASHWTCFASHWTCFASRRKRSEPLFCLSVQHLKIHNAIAEKTYIHYDGRLTRRNFWTDLFTKMADLHDAISEQIYSLKWQTYTTQFLVQFVSTKLEAKFWNK